MYDLLVALRAHQLLAHNYHHLCARVPFHQDHEFFGSVYTAADSDYDDVAERIVGLEGEAKLNLQPLMAAVVAKIGQSPSVGVKENSVFYEVLLKGEMDICAKVKILIDNKLVSRGTEQLIGDIANKSEVRQYKMKQRLKR